MPQALGRLVGASLLLLAAALPLAAQNRGPGGGGPQPPARAGYMVVEESEVALRLTLTGRALAWNSTQLRPRVGGVVTKILYAPGSMVEIGDPLFSIDPLTYELALASAEAAKARAEAERDSAQLTFDRTKRLSGTGASSEATLETADAALRKAEASLREAEASLVLARAQLDWTTVKAPIRGIVSVAQVSEGDLVTANQAGVLAEIVQMDPVLVDLSEPWPARQRIEARAAAGEITLLPVPELTVLTEGGGRIEGVARLLAAAPTVSATTGTRMLRFEMENPRGLIAPGAFIHAELAVGEQRAMLIPQRATQRERDGSLSGWVAVDGKAQKRRLTETGTEGNAWVVTAGVAPGEWLLIDGTNNMRDGQDVAPVPAEIDENGVVRDAATAAEGEGGAQARAASSRNTSTN